MTGRGPSVTPSITGRVGTSRAWARDTSSKDMALPSACPHDLSRGLHPRAPLTLLYPSLCRMSSPNNRRAAPAHQGFQAATRPEPTVRLIVRERLARQSAFSGKTLIRDSVFSKACEPCPLPLRHPFRESCRTRPLNGGIEPHYRGQSHWRSRLPTSHGNITCTVLP